MKRILFFLFMGFTACGFAQSNINDLLAAGIEDAEQYTNDYLAPALEATIYNLGGSWYNTADAKPLGGFEISIVGNLAFFGNKDDKKAFVLNTADYENLQFTDGSISKTVSTALGDIEGVQVFVEDESGLERADFELPSGLASEDINFIPSGFIQASVGLIKGTEVKARFLPKIDTDDVSFSLFGVGLQHEFTKHLPADKMLPIAISAVIGYTQLNGEYDLTSTSVVDGSNQRLDTKIKTWNFQAVVSTRLPIINFYGGLGYLSGTSETNVLGTYVVTSGPLQTTYVDPFSVSADASGVIANVGTKLKLGFFRINADYSLGEFNRFTFGVNFGFR